MKTTRRFAISAIVAIALVISGCDQGFEDPLPPRDGLFYPIGMEMHPDGRFLYVVNSNFNRTYRPAQGGTVSVIDTQEGEILGQSSPFIPSFGSQIALNAEGDRAYVPTRHNNEISVLTVAEQGQAIYCDGEDGPTANPDDCTSRRVPDSSGARRIPTDPFAISVGEAERQGERFDTVHLSHLGSDAVTAMAMPGGNLSGSSMRSASLLSGGANQLAVRPGTEVVFAAPRGTNEVAGFRPFINNAGEVEAIVRAGSVRLTSRDRSLNARGMEFNDDGSELYVATRSPAALYVVGMEADGGSPAVIDTITLEHRPSELHGHRGPDGVKRLYIPSYERGVVEVVDVEQGAVIDIIEVGRSPYSVRTDQGTNCQQAGERCQGYVTLFDAGEDRFERCDDGTGFCGAVAVIDLDPESDDYHKVIDVID